MILAISLEIIIIFPKIRLQKLFQRLSLCIQYTDASFKKPALSPDLHDILIQYQYFDIVNCS